MPLLFGQVNAKLGQGFGIVATLDFADGLLQMQFLFHRQFNDHPVSPAHKITPVIARFAAAASTHRDAVATPIAFAQMSKAPLSGNVCSHL
jgi:hypothetical protein